MNPIKPKHSITEAYFKYNVRNFSIDAEQELEKIINECHATLLHIHLHRFTENGGVSGVALLAESHISIHTWPERDYAALDVFMCGEVSPAAAVPILKQAFQPTSLHVEDYKRGVTV